MKLVTDEQLLKTLKTLTNLEFDFVKESDTRFHIYIGNCSCSYDKNDLIKMKGKQ